MGINLGAFIAPLITGWLGENVSWHAGFLVAAIGMTLALIQYVLGRGTLPESSERASRPATPEERARVIRTSALWLAAAVVLLAVDVSLGWFELDHVINALTVLAVAVPIVYFIVMFRTPGLTPTEISRLRAFIWIFVAATVFWMIYDQAGSLLNIFAQEKVDRDVFGFEFPASWYQSVNPVLILALAPVFAWLWTYLGTRQPSTPVKFAMALWGIALSFVIMALAGARGLRWRLGEPAVVVARVLRADGGRAAAVADWLVGVDQARAGAVHRAGAGDLVPRDGDGERDQRAGDEAEW